MYLSAQASPARKTSRMVENMGSPTVPIETSVQAEILAVSTLCIVIPTILIGLRFVAKMRVRGKLDASDYCLLAALVCFGIH